MFYWCRTGVPKIVKLEFVNFVTFDLKNLVVLPKIMYLFVSGFFHIMGPPESPAHVLLRPAKDKQKSSKYNNLLMINKYL